MPYFVFFLQITVYLGKRDFVDHITHVDPIGKRDVEKFCKGIAVQKCF
jgi:hypothetical protein